MSSEQERLLLEVLGSDQAPAELPRSGMLAVGSSPDKAGMLVNGQGVADVHCAIGRTKDGSFAIKDLGSKYGTLLNGAKISQSRLARGDEILLGSIRLRVVTAADRKDLPLQAATVSRAPARPSGAAAPRRPKQKLPQIQGYKLQQLLGKGSMGDVYLAVQISLDREVALKVLSKNHEEDQAFVASFQAEARSAAALNHPNVVTVHDVGEQDGVHYLTMEYMDRSSLEQRVAQEGPLPWTIVLAALKDAASGLVYAESRGIVHRDIKPANLMQNHSGTTKIADLGLATSIGSEDALDGDRKIFGTPHFISPEQIKGEKADCRSDLYSLGSTAYRLLTGHTPYEGQNTREILRDKLRGEHVPIQERASDVPAELVAIVERLMQLDPADRYPSATALVRDIERLQSGSSTQPPVQSGASRGLLIGLALSVVAVLVIALTFVKGDGSAQDSSTHAGNGIGQVPELVTAVTPEQLTPIPTVEPPAGDSDLQEQLFEQSAENAFLRLGQRDLAPGERALALRALGRDYFGTTSATAAIAEAAQIDEQVLASAEAEGAHNTALTEIFQTLEAAAKIADPALRPGDALRAMRTVEGLEVYASDDAFRLRLDELESKVISTALEQFSGVLQEITSLEQAGDFERAREVMTDLLGRTDLPDFGEGLRPVRVDEVETLASSLRTRLEGLDSLKTDFLEQRQVQDRVLTGHEIGSGSGFLGQLASLDFAAAGQRCRQLRAGLHSEQGQSLGAALAARVALAAKALPLLSNNFSNWRRKTVVSPTEKRGGSRDVVSISPNGLVLQVAGKQQPLSWAEFGGHTKALHLLFSKRLNRAYNTDETRQIGALMHFSAITECLLKAGEMFDQSNNAVFTSAEAEDLPLAFDHALEWCATTLERDSVLRDQAASRLLGQALNHASDGSWTTAVAELEQLYRQYPDSWIVRLLSDGSPLTLPE